MGLFEIIQDRAGSCAFNMQVSRSQLSREVESRPPSVPIKPSIVVTLATHTSDSSVKHEQPPRE